MTKDHDFTTMHVHQHGMGRDRCTRLDYISSDDGRLYFV